MWDIVQFLYPKESKRMSNRSSSPKTSRAGRNTNRPGTGFSFDDMPRNKKDQRRETGKVVTHDAYLFRPGEKDPFIKGVPLKTIEGNESLFFDFVTSHVQPGKAATQTTNTKDITKYLAKRNPVYAGNTLVSVDLPSSKDGGILIFVDIPSSGGLRLYSGTMPIDEYRTRICYAEVRFQEEALRRDYKADLRTQGAGFRYPGNDGKQLSAQGLEVLFPLFDDTEDRKKNVPHQHIVRADKGSSFEVMFEYHFKTATANWFQIDIDDEGIPTAFNIRSESMPYMIEARRRASEEEANRKSRLKAQQEEL